MKLENIDIGVRLFHGSAKYIYFENCEISAKCFCTHKNCTLKFIDSVVSIETATHTASCDWLRSHGRIALNDPEGYNNALFQHNAITSRLEIYVLKAPSTSTIALNPLTTANSVLAISLPADWPSGLTVTGDPMQPSVMDSTLLHGVSAAVQITDVILLPTEYMKNADKLNAAGFLVERVY